MLPLDGSSIGLGVPCGWVREIGADPYAPSPSFPRKRESIYRCHSHSPIGRHARLPWGTPSTPMPGRRRQWVPAFAGMTGEGRMAIGGRRLFFYRSRLFLASLGPARAPSTRTGSRVADLRAVEDRCREGIGLPSVSGCYADGVGRGAVFCRSRLFLASPAQARASARNSRERQTNPNPPPAPSITPPRALRRPPVALPAHLPCARRWRSAPGGPPGAWPGRRRCGRSRLPARTPSACRPW